MICRLSHNLFPLFVVVLMLGFPCGRLVAQDDHKHEASAETAHGHDDSAAEHHEGGEHDAHQDDDHAHGEELGSAGGLHGEEHHAAPPLAEDLALWSILAFAGFCFAVHKLGIWNWMLTSMADREKQEGDLIATAESHLAQAKAELDKYRGQLEAMDETIAETLAEAGRDAEYTQGEIIETANHEADQMLQRSQHEIQRVRDQKLNDLFEQLSHKVADATEAKLRNNLQADDQDRLIDSTLSQLAAN